MRIPLFVFALACIATATPVLAHAASWPTATGTLISSSLHAQTTPSGRAFEPSDVTIIDGKLLVVSDEGDVATMGIDGGNVSLWLTSTGNDQEGVTVVGNTLYVLNERYRDVYAYDLTTHELLRTYDLSPWIAGEDNLGPEALVYHHGQWLVGHSETEEMFAFDLSGATPVLLGSWNSGLHVRALHSGADGLLYIMSSGRVVAIDDSRAVRVEYTLPSGPTGPEGFTLATDCAAGSATAFIAYDSGSIYRFENFPVACLAAAPVPPPEQMPTPEPIPEPVPEPVTFTSAVGVTNGDIAVSYSDGTTATYSVYDIATKKSTTVSQYQTSEWLVVTAPFFKRVAVVNAYDGAVLAMRQMPKTQAQLNAWLLAVLGF